MCAGDEKIKWIGIETESVALMDGKISVIVPVYKVEQYLNRCIQSIVNQSYNDLEIILVDDGSPDGCPSICNGWAVRDKRIKVIHKENGGLSSARNAGLDVATGDYIAFVDSDDYVASDIFEIMLDAAIRNNVDVACCGRVRVSAAGEIEMFTLPEEQVFTGEEAIKQLLIGGTIEEAAWDKLYKADIFNKRRFPDGEINEDIVQTIEILGTCRQIVHVGKALYYYCENRNSITTSKYNSGKMICIKHLDQISDYLDRSYPKLLKCFYYLELRYCQGLLYLLLDNAKTLNDYKDDYKEVYTRFKIAYKATAFGKGTSQSERMKGALIYFRVYYWMRRLKKGRLVGEIFGN